MDRPEPQDRTRFGRFELVPAQRKLVCGGKPVALSSRAFDILNLLVEQRHRIVTKDEIIAVVWRGMIVDDNNLAVQMSALRRILAQHSPGQFVATVPGQGYRFVGSVEPEAAPDAAVPDIAPLASPLPAMQSPRWRPRTLLAVSCVLAACGAWLIAWHRPRVPEPPRLSIAVLPFRDLSDDTRQTYLADAITDDLTTDLSHIPGSKVIARESADVYRNHAVPTATIGQALDVRYLLEGSVRREADTLHINAQLIEARSGAHVWANMIDVGREGLATARTDIVHRLASVLNVTLVQAESARSLHDNPDDPDALDFYLRARSVLDRGDDLSSLQQAQSLFEHAVALSPDYADALAALGSVLVRKIYNFDDADEWADHARAQDVISKALLLAPHDVAAIAASGELAFIDRHCDQARERFALVLALQPDDLSAHKGLALCNVQLGRMRQAIDEFQTILRIDPLSPGTPARQSLIGMSYLMSGNPGAALEWLNRASAAILPNTLPDTHLGWREWHEIYLIAALQLNGDSQAATKQYRAYADANPYRTVWRLTSYASHATSILPGFMAYRDALHTAGMPIFVNEADAASTETARSSFGDFEPAPAFIDGVGNLTAQALHNLMQKQPPPLVLDIGSGAAAVPGAVPVWPLGVWGDRNQMLLDAAHKDSAGRAIVLMGDSASGSSTTNAIRYLIAHGASNVLWFRGGEEAWAQAGFPCEDRRSP